MQQLKSEKGKNIYCDGGAEIVNLLMMDDLIDEYIISVVPVFLGSCKLLFQPGRPGVKLVLAGSVSFSSGLVQSHYVRK